jgi:N utilization substance protein A
MSNELQVVIDYMERERGIERETLINAVESALLAVARKNHSGGGENLRVEIHPKTLEIRSILELAVVEEPTIEGVDISLSDARKINPNAKIGEFVEKILPPQDLGRIGAQTAKQAIMQKLRQAEKERIFEEYKDRVGQVVSGTVRRFERNDVIVEIGRAEAVLPSKERVPTEEYQVNERILAYILRINEQGSGPEVVLSRSHPDFVRRLFEQEITEIADNTVEIKGIAREAGFRSKVAVFSTDPKVDPVGACVGMRGIRVKNIVRELGGEKIDIVRWNPEVKAFVQNALAPARLSQLIINEDTHEVTVVVDGDQLSLAIGKKGQNARLTAKLTGWKIDIQKEESAMDFEERVAKAIGELSGLAEIGTDRASTLVQSGYLSPEGIIAAEIDDLAAMEGFDTKLATELRDAAEQYNERKHR